MSMTFDSRLADADCYLELIWRTDVPRPEGTRPQAIAYVTGCYSTPRKPWFYGCYGIHTCEGPTVADVKQELFALIEAGQ